MLRAHGVVGKFVEFYGPGVVGHHARRPGHDLQHEPGVRLHLRLLPDRRRDPALPAVHRRPERDRATWSRPTPRSRACGTTRPTSPATPSTSSSTSARSSPPWPAPAARRTGCRSTDAQRAFREVLPDMLGPTGRPATAAVLGRRGLRGVVPGQRPARDRRGRASPGQDARTGDRARTARRDACRPAEPARAGHPGRAGPRVDHGSVAIAAITSCTNTSNPSVMVAAGLLARNAVEPRPAQQAVGQDQPLARAPGSSPTTSTTPGSPRTWRSSASTSPGYGCMTCIGASGPLIPEVTDAVTEHDLTVVSVLSGNRNFDGRINPDVRMNYLASPPLVVAYALAGTMDIDLLTRPARHRRRRATRCTCATSGPTPARSRTSSTRPSTPSMFTSAYADVFDGDERWQRLDAPDRRHLRLGRGLDLHAPAAVPGRDDAASRTPCATSSGARVLVKLGDSVTTDHVSPAGAIPVHTPAGRVPHRASASSGSSSTPTPPAAATTR